jgi:spermidine synthase
LSAVAAHPELERVDNVELSPHVVEAAAYFWTNAGVIDHPKVRTIIDDGRNFVMATDEVYDVILLEPPEVFTAGVINLYTKDFYVDALDRLSEDGLLMQWLPCGESPVEDERMLFRALSDAFPYVHAWQQLDTAYILLVGSKVPLALDYQLLKQRMQNPPIARDMELSLIRDVDHLLSFFVFDDAAYREFCRDVPPTEDDRTVLDFTMPRYAGSGFGFGSFNIAAQQQDGRNPIHIATERATFYAERRVSIVPHLVNLGGEAPEAIAARIEAAKAIPIEYVAVPESEWRRW